MRQRKRTKLIATAVFLLVLPASCWAQKVTAPADVSKEVEKLTGFKIGTGSKSDPVAIPEGISVNDGVTQDEAVAIALWNNPGLHAELTALGIARADVTTAGQLTNPTLTMIFPFSFRILEAVANWPIESIWQRPRRVAAAKVELERVGETLVIRALDLVRDVRLAYADYHAAQIRAEMAAEVSRERHEIATLTNARLRVGDISELESNPSVTDARLAEERASRLAQDVVISKERLRTLLGFANDDIALNIVVPPRDVPPPVDRIISVQRAVLVDHAAPSPPVPALTAAQVDELIRQALDARPEMKAGELAIEAAGARAKWERSRILNVSAIAKEYGRGAGGWEQGPGVAIELPIFHRNNGNISRAEAEIERAAKQLIAAKQRIVSEVRESYTQFIQAREAHRLWRTTVLPAVEQDIRAAHAAYQAGDVAYLFVLENSRRYSDERLREADYMLATERARTQLERSVGRRLLATR